MRAGSLTERDRHPPNLPTKQVKSGASEADIWQTIDMFKERYSDYGSDRRSAIEFHTNQLEKLLLPTKLTKLCMWMLLNMDIGDGAAGSALALPSPAEAVASVPALELKAEEQAGGIMAPPLQASSEAAAAAGGEEQAPAQAQAQVLAGAGAGPEKGPAAAAAARRLWATVSAELGVTEEQQRQLLAQRETVKGMDGDLQVTSGMLSELRALINDKNASLDQELLEVQKILTPTQTAKFILWITKNPACMHMLNQLWRLVYEKAPLPAPGAGAGSGPGAALGGAEMEEPPAAKRAKVDGSASGSRNGNGAAATAAAAATQVAGPS